MSTHAAMTARDSLGQLLDAHPALVTLVSVVGAACLAWLALGAASFLYKYALRPAANLRRYGSWAVVTGATDGIGKAYCDALAQKGMNIVLVSRSEARLAACEAELRAKHGDRVQIRRCTADLCSTEPAVFQRVAACLEGLDVGILVNNAGMSSEYPEYLDLISDETAAAIVHLNTLAPTLLAKLVLPGMKQRRRGVVVNIGSGAATVLPSTPLTVVYTATKAYIEALSQSLDAECREFGIRVQNQVPMYVATKMSKVAPALDKPSPAGWARAAVAQIGRETSFPPYWVHGLQVAGLQLAPRALIAWTVRRILFKMRQEQKKQA